MVDQAGIGGGLDFAQNDDGRVILVLQHLEVVASVNALPFPQLARNPHFTLGTDTRRHSVKDDLNRGAVQAQ